ncbi:MAG TPA: hypothetical protein VKY45_07930 [Marinilabiliaceae bacterium]|nr:hypothetical protein [Marinilabiliaceae bacterium]
MNFLNQARLKTALYLLRRKAKNRSRRMKAINLDQVQSMAVLFQVDGPASRKRIANFIHPFLLKGVECRVYGYIHMPDEHYNYISDKTYTFFSKKDLNLFYQPKEGIMDDFIDREWDLLLMASQDFHFPLKWMLKLSIGKFKVGPSGHYNDELDFMIAGEDLSSDVIINEITHYLGDLRIARSEMA